MGISDESAHFMAHEPRQEICVYISPPDTIHASPPPPPRPTRLATGTSVQVTTAKTARNGGQCHRDELRNDPSAADLAGW